MRTKLCTTSLASLIFAAWISPAYAQSTPTPALTPPPVRSTADDNHVNLTSGTMSMTVPDLSIGTPNAGLVHARTLTSSGWWDSNFVVATVVRNKASLSIGSVTRTFTRSLTNPNLYLSDQGDGFQLTITNPNLTVADADGNQYQFISPYVAGRIGSFYGTAVGDTGYIASQIIKASGEVISLTYKGNQYSYGGYDFVDYRLQSVSSSLGYQLKYAYSSNVTGDSSQLYLWLRTASVTAINNQIDYCDPAADSCATLTQSWPAVSYATTPSGANTVESVTDPLGRVTKFTTVTPTVTPAGPLIGIRLPGNSSDTFTIAYDANKRVQTVIRDGQTWTYNWAISGSILTGTVTDPLAHTEVTTADTTKLVLLTDQDGNGHVTTYQYDTKGRLAYVIVPEGTISGGVPTAGYTQLSYDDRGNVSQKTMVAKTGSSLANIVTTANYDTTCVYLAKCNRPNWTKDANGNQTDYTYDTITGNILTVTAPAPTTGAVRPQARYSYTAMQAYFKNSSGAIVASGQPVTVLTGISACRTLASCAGTSDETTTTLGYGPQTTGVGNNLLPVSTTRAAGDNSVSAITSASYDNIGNLATATDPLSHVTTYFYDADRERLGAIGPDPDGAEPLKNRATRLTYNSNGLVTLAERGTATGTSLAAFNAMTTLQQMATGYDSANRKIQESAQAGGTTYSVTQYSYDAAGRLDCTAVRMNPATFSALPTSACTATTVGSYGPDRISRNGYDNANQLLTVTDAYGVTGQQRVTVTNSYNPDGTLATLADAKNNLTTYLYDGFDRLSTTQYPSPTVAGTSNAADYEQLGYDADGNVTSRQMRDGRTLTFGYDALNRRTSQTPGPGDLAATYSYDLAGHLVSANDPNNAFENFSWDALGRKTSESAARGGTQSMQYDAAGRRTRLTWNDGFYVTYDYDNTDAMTAIHENGGTVLASFGYDDLGRRTSRSFANGTSTSYGYDAVSRLTSLSLNGGSSPNMVTLGAYNPAGQIGYRTDSNDAYAFTAFVNVNRAYVTNGLNQYTSAGSVSFSYGTRGNLTASGSSNYSYHINSLPDTYPGGYIYVNALGEWLDASPEQLWMVHDGDQAVAEWGYNGSLLRRYVFGPGMDEAIVWYEGSGTSDKRYLDQDERGSVTRITKQDGSTLAINSYDEYGIPSPTNQGRFQYTGQAWIPTLGMYYYKARTYSATLGRFVQPDPAGYDAGPNWYNYAQSDPINLVDPSGLQDVPEITITGTRLHNGNTGAPGSRDPEGRPTIDQDRNHLRKPTPQKNQRNHRTCDGVPGFAAYQEAAMSAIAENPASSYTPAWLRGIFIHSAFSRLVMEIPGSSVNVSYKDGQVAGWLDFGSVRPDAVNGVLNSPNFVVELKTSNARLVDPQLSNYLNNLPPNTLICEIYEQGM